MPADPKVLARRREAILKILKEEKQPIEQQADLVERLRLEGIQATQSSVSRDLRALGVIRVQGYYELPEWAEEGHDSPFDAVAHFVRLVKPVNPCHILLVTRQGAGHLVNQALEDSGWDELLGTVAGINSVLVLTDNTIEQRMFYERLKRYRREE